MARYILCPHCNEIWQISKITATSYGRYKCPKCSEKNKSLQTANQIGPKEKTQ